MPQQDLQQADSPQDVDGVVIASSSAPPSQGGQQLGVWDGGEEFLDGLEVGAVVEAVPGEEGLGDGDSRILASPSPDVAFRPPCRPEAMRGGYTAINPRVKRILVEKMRKSRPGWPVANGIRDLCG
jgi:hypothetical protein